jgi:hypothetical protein
LILFQAPSLLRTRGLSLHTIEVWWLVAVVMIGTLWTSATHLTPHAVSPDLRLAADMDLFDLLGESHDFEEHFEWSVPSGVGLELRNSYGSVNVASSDDDRVHLRVLTSVRASGMEQASALAPELAFRIEEGDPSYVIRSNHSDMPPDLARRFRTSLEVQVPPFVPIAVDNSRGTVRLDGLSGPQAIRTRDGEIVVRPAGGSVEANTLRGDVAVMFNGAPRGSVSMVTDQGDVRLELPAGSEFAIEGDIWRGSLVSEFPEVMALDTSTPEDQERLRIEGQVGQRTAEVYLRVRDGNVALVERGDWPWGSSR